MSKSFVLDKLDKEILSILIKDARFPYTEIAKKLNISGGTVHFRIKKLEEAGVICGSNLVIDPTKVGYDIVAFLGITTIHSFPKKINIEKLRNIKEIVELHVVTGRYDLFAKAICRDSRDLFRIITEEVKVTEGIMRCETYVSLDTISDKPLAIA